MVNLSRRTLMRTLALGTAGGVIGPVRLLAARLPLGYGAVWAVHNEQLYADSGGLVTPWHPPAGLRGLDATAHLDETDFRMAHPYG